MFTGAQLQPPDPFATGTSFTLPDVPLLCASFAIYAFASVAIPLIFAPAAPSILPFTSRRVPTVVIPAKAALPFLATVERDPTKIPSAFVSTCFILL